MHGSDFVGDIAIVLGVAALTGLLFRRLGQPSVLGYLLAGLIVGPYLPFPVFADAERVQALSEFGVVLVMFAVGLEFRLKTLLRLLPVAGLTCALQVGALIWGGFSLARVLGWGPIESTILGASIAISSTMVVSKVLEQRPVERDVRELIFGVLILQDVVAIGLIAAVTAIAAGGGLAAGELVLTVGRLVAVLVALVGGGLFVVPRLIRVAMRQRSAETLVVVIGGICFGLALLAHELGYSVALGAFIAGILVAEAGQGRRTEHLFQPLRDTFAAVFFVSIGMTVDPRAAVEHGLTSLAVFGVVVLGQAISVTIGALLSGAGTRRAVTAALALGQIGEFAFIIAGIGVAANVVSPDLMTIVVTVAVLTAFTTPLLVGRAPSIVQRLDRALPSRLRSVLTLYGTWLEQLRATGEESEATRSATRRVIRVLIVDALAVIAVIAATAVWFPKMVEATHRIGLMSPYDEVAVTVAASLVAMPFVAGLLWNTRALGRLASESLLGAAGASGDPGTEALRRALVALVELGAVVGIGVPAVALIRPFLPGPYAAPLAGLLLLMMGGLLWIRATASRADIRSGAGRVLEVLAQQVDQDQPSGERPSSEPSTADATGLRILPGLGPVLGVRLDQSSYAVGKTLAEIDLRAKTDAHVMAIHRENEQVLVPTGAEKLEVGDVLALAGTEQARELGQRLLVAGPEVLQGRERPARRAGERPGATVDDPDGAEDTGDDPDGADDTGGDPTGAEGAAASLGAGSGAAAGPEDGPQSTQSSSPA